MADITIDQLATQTFYQIPEIFFTRIQHNDNGYVRLTSPYVSLSSDAKLAYGALYNRCKLSVTSFQKGNQDYVDDNGAVFLIFTVSDLMLLLDKGKMKVTQIKKELQEHGLLREVRQGLNKPNRLYLQLVDSSLEVTEHFTVDGILQKTVNALGEVIYQNEENLSEKPQPLDTSGSPFFGRPKSGRQEVHKTDAIKTEKSKTDSINDTNRYRGKFSSEPLSISEAFKLGEHSFLTEQIVIELASFGELAPILQDKIFQAKRAVEKQFDYQLKDRFPLFSDTEKPRLYGEFFVEELYREVTKLRSKVSIGQVNGRPVRDITGYFYRMLTLFWKKCLWLVLHYDFIALEQRKNAGEILIELVDTSVKDIDDELYLWVGKEVI